MGWGERTVRITFPSPALFIQLMLWSTYCGLGTGLGINDTEVNKSGKIPDPQEAHILVEKT